MHLLRKTRRTTMLVGAGAVAAYFLDPDNGAARRQRIVEQLRELTGGRDELAPSQLGDPPASSVEAAADAAAEAATEPLPPLREPAPSAAP